jgi:hypothetical protein
VFPAPLMSTIQDIARFMSGETAAAAVVPATDGELVSG